MNTILKKISIVLVILIATGIALVITSWIFTKQSIQRSSTQNQPLPPVTSDIPSTSSIPAASTVGTKTYRNEEWGFEFKYSNDLILKENTFRSYYSKFNLELFKPIGEKRDISFLVNIVLPEFAESSFSGLQKTTSEVTVAGVQGIKYEYEYQGFPHTTVILPFGELRMILATGEGSKQYLDEFNQILASFKFLK